MLTTSLGWIGRGPDFAGAIRPRLTAGHPTSCHLLTGQVMTRRSCVFSALQPRAKRLAYADRTNEVLQGG